MSDANLSFEVTHDEMKSFMQALADMQAKEVLAGFPAEDDKPRQDAEGNPEPITNAAIAYIQNTGMPEQNLPARPFMVEGIEDKREQITDAMEAVGLAALDGDRMAVDQGLHAVGAIARDGIKEKIIDGPFAPLAEATLRARAAMGGAIGKAAQAELDGVQLVAGSPNVRPLNLTGQLRNAANYAVRGKE
jgi:hypothetical protein